jgi:hypothetical protein
MAVAGGAIQESKTWLIIPLAVSEVGAEGVVAGIPDVTAPVPIPAAFVPVTRTK